MKNNNREIYASDKSQKLSDDYIKEMKQKGMKSDDLIKMIVDNNASMEKRSIFSQEKMIKKKERKYKQKIWISPTNLFNIIESNYLQDPKKIK